MSIFESPSLNQILYFDTVTDRSCHEIVLTPWTLYFVSSVMTFLLFVVIQRLTPNTGVFSFVITSIIFTWYVYCMIVAVYREYLLWVVNPGWRVFTRCTLNKEFNERLAIKYIILNTLVQKLVANLLVWKADKCTMALRIFMTIFRLLIAPAFFGKVIPVLGASLGFGWAFLYLYSLTPFTIYAMFKIHYNEDLDWIRNSGPQTPIHGFWAQSDADNYDPKKPFIPSRDVSSDEMIVYVKVHAKRADQTSIVARTVLIILYPLTVYALIVSWDWRWTNNGISYGDSFTAFASLRPSISELYSQIHSYSAEDVAYIASSWS